MIIYRANERFQDVPAGAFVACYRQRGEFVCFNYRGHVYTLSNSIFDTVFTCVLPCELHDICNDDGDMIDGLVCSFHDEGVTEIDALFSGNATRVIMSGTTPVGFYDGVAISVLPSALVENTK